MHNIHTPFIHLFKTSNASYVYDVNTNSVVDVSAETYDILESAIEKGKDINSSSNQEIRELLEQGYLKANRPNSPEHPASHLLSELINNSCSMVILQVTQRCNLRCEYCIYSGEHKDRAHSQKEMTWEMAKKGIDYLISHSENSDTTGISFYGGEPLLNMKLIEKCVEYVKSLNVNRGIGYSLTTNGTLLTEEICDFFAENNFGLMFSLDGPQAYHDKHRKYAFTQKGSHSDLIKNVHFLYKKYPEYFIEQVQFNCVADQANSFSKVSDFFTNNTLYKNQMPNFSPIGYDYAETKADYSDEYISEIEYEMFKISLSRLGVISEDSLSVFRGSFFSELAKFAKAEGRGIGFIGKSHHSGPCIPGVTRLFLTANGDFFPCERVSEISEFAKIGNVDEGVSLEKARQLLNVEKFSSVKCQNCFAYTNCTNCLKMYDGITEYSAERLESFCVNVRNSFDDLLKKYATLKELDYKFIPELLGEEKMVKI